MGESALSHTFRHARLAAPTILLFDDLDMLFEARNMDLSQARNSSMLATMLMELDGLEVAAGHHSTRCFVFIVLDASLAQVEW